MDLAVEYSLKSTDRSRKVGAIIVDASGRLISYGWNGFPSGVADQECRHERPAKYFWTEHAERNAIYLAAKNGVPLKGCTMYVPWFPCMDCARGIVQSGISRLVAYHPDLSDPIWGGQFTNALVLFEEAGVIVSFI
jgi:dCMP deaminase